MKRGGTVESMISNIIIMRSHFLYINFDRFHVLLKLIVAYCCVCCYFNTFSTIFKRIFISFQEQNKGKWISFTTFSSGFCVYIGKKLFNRKIIYIRLPGKIVKDNMQFSTWFMLPHINIKSNKHIKTDWWRWLGHNFMQWVNEGK